MWIIVNIFTSFLSYDTISPLFNVKRNLPIFIKIQDRNLFFFVFKVVKTVKFSAITRPMVTDKFIKLDNSIGISYKCRPITVFVTLSPVPGFRDWKMPIPGFRVRPMNGGCVCSSVSRQNCAVVVFLTTNYMFRLLLMSELWHCLILFGVLEVFWFYATFNHFRW